MSDRIIAFRETGEVRRPKAGDWVELQPGCPHQCVLDFNYAKHPILQPIPSSDLIVAAGGLEGALDRIYHELRGRRLVGWREGSYMDAIRAAIVGPEPEPPLPEWAEAFIRERYGDDCAVVRHEMAKHYAKHAEAR